jgi:plastocyanin
MSDTRSTPLAGRRWRALAVGAVLTVTLAACASASTSGSARCAVSPDASPNATIQVLGLAFGAEVTIKAGQAVVFTNGAVAHTITEGTRGKAASNACVDEPIGASKSVIVTFKEPGDYQITCTIHSSMQTVVHVQ